METAEESARQYGARLAFDDYHKMLEHPEIDAVAVVLRVPAHYDITRDAIDAGKHVFTEWPLGRTTKEAKQLAAQAKECGPSSVSSPEPIRPSFI
jgi:predicted dehydrogenase